ncbi:MAG: AAA family ATPase [Gemmatimonadetes bacterium]|nr:AAA family ATPase [Gemmatimonadota bacterium]MBP6670093.1 AAA family ATPase [Gemmatimonadales bacterium]MBK6778663.1 AAA family ATPase [Gemmatimonadota bacterium]MBK7349028.1 AAA family ATPase [Gemmatimonadota bacterium]MBK7714590.1 AAA family ATPase [Gemmatimonadota bacterium]
MRLTKLELSGFKSFADTATLTFQDGVTAIVGPNGCGKSNVSDAVRWVLGEQSARILRGGKMEDVIFQGSTARRPVNVTQVSLFLDNTDGDLPIAYREVQITRRLSRSGQSDYLLNGTVVRLRDIQDLLRGTGLGTDAGVVIEAKMIEWLLSDRAEDRRSLFEEAAGIGLYRDRRQTTERRLEETGGDLQRVEDLIAEVQSQLRSLARQKGKAERHARLMEEKFAVQLTLAKRLLADLGQEMATSAERHAVLEQELPQAREALTALEERRDEAARARGLAESRRTEIARHLGDERLELGRLDGDLALAAERLANAAARKLRASEERGQMESRRSQATREREAAQAEHAAAQAERERIQAELGARTAAEQEVRLRLGEQRQVVRQLEEEIQKRMQTLRALEGERHSLESDLASLREQATTASGRLQAAQAEQEVAERRRADAVEVAERHGHEAKRTAVEAERARHLVGELRRREALERADRRGAEETLAQLTARRQALEELERDRVGLAPGAAALLSAREQFGEAIIGPLSDFIRTGREDAELAERLLGEWVHAVLVRDEGVVAAILAWHAAEQPGAIALLPASHLPAGLAGADPLPHRLYAQGPAEPWVRAFLAGTEALDPAGRALRRPNGAIVLAGAPSPSGPLRRRAELESLGTEVSEAQAALHRADLALGATVARLAEAEAEQEATGHAADHAREAERTAVASREDAIRIANAVTRERGEAETNLRALTERIERSERRLQEIDAALTEGDLARARLDENLGQGRALLAELESQQESARDARVHWQVQEAQLQARIDGAATALERAMRIGTEADHASVSLAGELERIETDTAQLAAQQAQWIEARGERRVAVTELETATQEADQAAATAGAALESAELDLHQNRDRVEQLTAEYHRLELGMTEASGRRRSIVERVETEWKKPVDTLLAEATMLDLDLETLENESRRIVEALEGIGPVNALAVEEHAEEAKRLEFLTAQRDDLVAARQSLQQAIREIDGTARTMFLETFTAIRTNFLHVFQTLFGGGECDLRLSNPEDPLESEIDIHAAPRGKKVQRIHLLSTGERYLVAVSLLFSIYLTKPSPFCLMDEVDAPLDDANVGRFIRLLEEFRKSTQFIVITHNPRTMQAAESVYGVTMQEPGVSSIVGVRLGELERV